MQLTNGNDPIPEQGDSSLQEWLRDWDSAFGEINSDKNALQEKLNEGRLRVCSLCFGVISNL